MIDNDLNTMIKGTSLNHYFKYRFSKLLILILLFSFISGCSFKSRTYDAPNAVQYTKAFVKGYSPDIRYWGDKKTKLSDEDLKRFMANREIFKKINILALSGGAEDGAYGAGF